ncbi:DNA-directed RNA polymerase subunit beta'' [Talaromyces islandicus]|uniref:DNA-directed RNA polymerase subunit beta n=1 Tax=Talaromyces islandicus TaxID=28573 RepID=A0A0U1M6Y1_TALIS|nr:DNA-directed RNA polymerase subunit beta'' [Talaromyces islandicus]
MATKALTSSALDAFYKAEKEQQKGQPVPPQNFTKRSHLTLYEIIDLPIALLSVPIVGFLALLTGPFRERKRRRNPEQGIARTLLLHVGYSILRRVVSRFSPMQIQAISPSTSTEYKMYTWRKGVQNQTVDLGEKATGHWVGNKDAKNVLIWYHGGGFAVPANRGYFIFFDKFIREMEAAGKDVAVFVVAYTLIPAETYPTQLRQSVSGLRYILQQKNRKAENVFLGGDSAGGNLVLGVLSHLAHPHPEIEPLKLAMGEEIGAATLISPWTSMETTFPPQETEPLGDLIHPNCAKFWATGYLAGRPRDNYTDARLAPVEWWNNVPVKKVLVTAGGYELLHPFIEYFTEKFSEGLGQDKVEFIVGAGEAHVAPMFNLMLGDSVETEQGKRVKSFYRECFRLKKECTPSSTVRKKRQRQGNSHTSRLEQKLDGLVSLLKTNGQTNSPYYDSATANLPCGWDAPEACRSRNVAANIQATADARTTSSLCDSTPAGKTTQPFAPLTPASTSSAPFPYSIPRDAEVSNQDAEHYLQLFRTKHLSNFPFYYLPETKASAELRQEKPFFWLSIMSVASTNLTQQLSLARVVRDLASKEIMEGERTLDLLLGLICICGWGQYQVQLGPLLTVFCHLLLALTSDLELQRMPHTDPSKHPRCPPPNVHYKFQIPNTRTMEHRRTILAVYLLTSSLSACHQRLDYLMWSPYLDDCLKQLDETNEAPNDKLLVHLVKIQLVTDQGVQLYSRLCDRDTEESTRFLGQYIISLREQLRNVRERIPSHLKTKVPIELASTYSQIAINELILLRLQHVSLAQEADNQAMDALLECAKSIKRYLESFISSFEPLDYMGMSFNIWKQMSSSMFLVARLVGLDDPGWDPNILRNIVYLPDIIDGFAGKMAALVDMIGWKTGGAENVYMRSIKMLSLTRNWARSIYAITEQQPGLDQEAARQQPASLAIVWQEEERRRWQQQQQQEQTQQTADVAAAAEEEEAMATAQMAGGTMLPAFDQEMWSDDMFGLWDIYSGRPAFAFTE